MVKKFFQNFRSFRWHPYLKVGSKNYFFPTIDILVSNWREGCGQMCDGVFYEKFHILTSASLTKGSTRQRVKNEISPDMDILDSNWRGWCLVTCGSVFNHLKSNLTLASLTKGSTRLQVKNELLKYIDILVSNWRGGCKEILSWPWHPLLKGLPENRSKIKF
jgi:hypothetical protein